MTPNRSFLFPPSLFKNPRYNHSMKEFFANLEIPFEVIWDTLGAFWNLKVASIDNKDLTVANILIAIVIFIVGFKLARRFSRWIVSSLERFHHVNENTTATLEAITFYTLLIVFTFTSLSIAQVPLNSFALIGGALAIGFGFGSQNIIKNFISGLILMIEQPIRVGDIINVEGSEGRIHRIGARSTHIRTYDNLDILVPNSTLLENNVVNWTLSDQDVRTRVMIGVAYGSDTRQVERLLLEVTRKNPKVLDSRPVVCYFSDFGDNALTFEVQFWCHMPRPSVRRQAESDVRHDIYATLNEAGIAIAYPQRDVHLSTTEPVEVRVVELQKKAG